ncbi:protein JASON-like isoform X2 [Amaranthus tricolor]|uniref:protein JASON-like isoform X2 n=1 Tax=Amaranthus tricolor TaxID=29722 RepID=UPI002585EFF5|nr:protein JASON-like isoform X2 [Amaranthus tricolor]
MPVTYCDVFTILWRSMACFFGCFGVRNQCRRRHSLPSTDDATKVVVVEGEQRQKIRLSSLFTAEDSAVKQRDNENLLHRAGQFDVNEELVEEAKFLKAIGTLPETPAEIRRRVIIVENTGNLGEQRPPNVLERTPRNPAEFPQGEIAAESLERSEVQSFHSSLDSSPETPEEVLKLDDAFAEHSVKFDTPKPPHRKSSPYPTPKLVTADMQTPGTAFATNMKSLTKGNVRIRSQYVYTVLNPIENLCQLDELKEENAVLEASDNEWEQLSKQGNTTPAVGSRENFPDKKLGDISLSAWLKPPLPKVDGDFPGRKKPSIVRTSEDRPIIGLVATHWNNQEEDTYISPKPWDGNGIPNSTTKYKEDQKVCWHATPFEERLEKALSEETAVPQRNPVMGAPISFEETEAQDTATSQLLSIPKSVVSF